jgi:hypothetical protein
VAVMLCLIPFYLMKEKPSLVKPLENTTHAGQSENVKQA